jgi:hypothetical protein
MTVVIIAARRGDSTRQTEMNTTTSDVLDQDAGYRVFGVFPKHNCRIAIAGLHTGAAKWSIIFDQPDDRHPAPDVNYASPGEALAAIENTCGWRQVIGSRSQ